MLDSKHRIEYHLATLPVPHPVIASVYFMDNLAYPWNTAVLQAGQWPGPLPPDRTVQLIPAVDWRASALVVERPGDFADRRVELMGCQKSGCPVSEDVDLGELAVSRDELAAGGRTAVIIAADGQAAGLIGIADAARDTSA